MNRWQGRAAARPERGRRAAERGGLLAATLMICATPATAAPTPATAAASAASAASAPAQSVEVTASDIESRQDATAAKLIVTHADLTRFGDGSLASALRRVPGITVSSAPGKDAEIRLRGLGSGYTQILVNGDPVAPGFSIESISPELIDRVEVLRSATADMSTQAIAGTINIILKRAGTPAPTELRVAATALDGRPGGNASVDGSGKRGTLSYGLGGNVGVTQELWPATADQVQSTSAGVEQVAQRTRTQERMRTTSVGLTPRLTWKPVDGESLGLAGLLEGRQRLYAVADSRTSLFGGAPTFADDSLVTHESSTLARGSATWKSALGTDGRIETKLTASYNERTADSVFDGLDDTPAPLLHRTIHSQLDDASGGLNGKYALGLGDDHTLAAGWDGQATRRAESRVQVETSPIADYPVDDLDEDYRARIGRLALFAQDEWNVTRRLSAYLGLRWEGLWTRTLGNALAPVATRSGVFSPTLQSTWKLPGTESDQLRLGIARTYKAPTAKDLIPRRWVVTDNSATTPNFQGNPDLLPELAWGLDAGYERTLKGGGFLGVNAYARHIDNVILSRVAETDGVWIETPVNAGKANVLGLELEAKGKLRQLVDVPADVDVRSGLTRNWSRLDAVPGPGNRLVKQTPLTATLGADWHLAALPLTLGGNYAYERGGLWRTSATQSGTADAHRVLDLYGLWNIDRKTHVRLAANNVLALKDVARTRYADATLDETQTTTTASFALVKLQLEMQL
jgi:outer membrane receptor for ferrienterochelin and colicins